MSRDITDYFLRDPRYLIEDGQQTLVETGRDGDAGESVWPSLLVDFSRKGMQILSPRPLQIGEKISGVLRATDGQLEVKLYGTVQWQRGAEGQQFAIGCQFDEEVDWEVMGELFLSGILDQKMAV
ncbi:MAG: hypothetical protein GTO26_02960 [Planctomycetales bacterium]|nr:hypothetical protein [Planctomycetales bacterium]NIO33952.1 hypothetical protein [Planctomycetales bacterium]NIO45735.1 hypothetical protein [Planctomycetales bacterium]NIP84585.1 hypothetical protein [Planctomycetales bacterium]